MSLDRGMWRVAQGEGEEGEKQTVSLETRGFYFG